MSEQDKSKREEDSRSAPPPPDPEDSGTFRWYEDLLDRILPKKDKTETPK